MRRQAGLGGRAAVAVLAAALAATACSGGQGGAGAGGAGQGGPGQVQGSQRTPGPATFAGRDGVQARWVIAQNKLPGSTAWQIHGPHAGIEGFANLVYARPGQRVTLYVSTSGRSFRAQAFRMGYYQGNGGRLVWQSGQLAGRRQPGCPLTRGINMVACDNWSPSLSFTVTRDFVQGDYLIKLTGPRNRQSYVPLTVWDPASTATYVIKNDVFTWQAWNPFGGYDFYTGLGSCPAGVYPLCSRARVVSFDRPYDAENGSGNFLTLEYPLVRWAEQHGLDVGYATDLTIQQHPSWLLRHRVLLSLGHDECWSLAERQAAVTARDHGVNIVFFAASPILRHVRTQASPLGPDRQEIDYRDSARDPLNGRGNPRQVTGNEWASPPASWPEYDFVGDTYEGFLEPGLYAGFRVADASAWVFQGTGLHDGSVIPGVIASDVDKFDAALGQPADDQVLARSPLAAGLGQTSLPPFESDMTYYTDPHGDAGIIDTGTNNWIPALGADRDGCRGGVCALTAVRQITANILRVFGQGPAGLSHPSVANWRQVTGQ
jgi:hypothetical protein